MAFRGWPVEAIEFFEGLEADNSKTYFQAHRSTYDHTVRAPMAALLAELADEFGEARIERPNRDIRFSGDKSPYKTSLAGGLGETGYIRISARGLGAGTGMYMMANDQLERFRASVAANASGQELAEIVGAVQAAGYEVTAHDVLKTAPRGYPKDHPRIEQLRLKGLVAWREWDAGAWLGTAKAKTRIVDLLHTARPLNDWLVAHVGPSTETSNQRRR